MDWGLFDKNANENKFLREEIVYSSTVSLLCGCTPSFTKHMRVDLQWSMKVHSYEGLSSSVTNCGMEKWVSVVSMPSIFS